MAQSIDRMPAAQREANAAHADRVNEISLEELRPGIGQIDRRSLPQLALRGEKLHHVDFADDGDHFLVIDDHRDVVVIKDLLHSRQ